MRIIIKFLLFLIIFIPLVAYGQKPSGRNSKQKDITRAGARASGASELLTEIRGNLNKIPAYMLKKARVIAVFSARPRFGEYSGDEDGVGLAIARDTKTNRWSAPIFFTVKGGSIRDLADRKNISAQMNDKETSLVFLGMNDRLINSFLTEQIVLGADEVCLPGTFAQLNPDEFVAYSVGLMCYIYARKLIIGASLEETTIRQDNKLNEAIYEEKKLDRFLPVADYMPKEILAFTEAIELFCQQSHRY